MSDVPANHYQAEYDNKKSQKTGRSGRQKKLSVKDFQLLQESGVLTSPQSQLQALLNGLQSRTLYKT